VARNYAGVLGFLAFLTCVVRGLIHGSGPIGLLGAACWMMLIFAAVGSLIGWIAQRTVEESVRGRVAAEVAADQVESAPARPAVLAARAAANPAA